MPELSKYEDMTPEQIESLRSIKMDELRYLDDEITRRILIGDQYFKARYRLRVTKAGK